MIIKFICHILNYERKNGCISYRKKRLDATKLLYSGTETRNACAFSHNVDFWSSGPRRRMNLVEWASSGDCPQTASDAAGGKNRRRRQRSRRRSRRRARRRSRFIAPAGARPPSAPPSAFTQRHPRFSIDNPEHPRRTWEYQSQTDADAQTDGLYSLKRSTTIRSVFAALMMASLPKTQTAPSRAMASRPTA